MDSLISASIVLQLLHPVVLLPMMGFILLQIVAYVLLISWIWFIAISLSEWFKLSRFMSLLLGMFIWCLAIFSLLELNRYYFPDSLFSHLMTGISFIHLYGEMILSVSLSLLILLSLLSYVHFFWHKKYRLSGSMILICGVGVLLAAFMDAKSPSIMNSHQQANIILIGLDSLRPDFTGFYGNQFVRTPNIDHFLSQAISFSETYTPLARTFPAWVSVLTGKYPKHHEARNNLIETASIVQQDTLVKKLQQAGYVTVYATDEKRFSNITKDYGFDRIVGPKMGVNDFLLGSLSDFPLTNLLVNLPGGRFLFPFNYGNRAATITYQPDKFLQLVKQGLSSLSDKPVFLSVHLCLSHWPHKWADQGQPESSYLLMQYIRSVNAVDQQFAALLQLLKASGLLENSWVVLLSDHGTAIGLPHDRIISEEKYLGDAKKMKLVSPYKFSSLPNQKNKPVCSLNTAYGQGTNILSLVQNHVLLAFQRFGEELPARKVNNFASLIDIAPTLLDLLSISPLENVDGISLRDDFISDKKSSRTFFMETGDSLSAIETDHIYIEKVIKHEIGIYRINASNGLLTMDPIASQSILKNKQLAVWQGDWMLAHYPASKRRKKIIPSYFVLANVKTGEWTVGLDSAFAKTAPVGELMRELKGFYEGELKD